MDQYYILKYLQLKLDPYRNVLFLIETKKNNIDIDIEGISKFGNEQEVLFTPYSKFLIKNIDKTIFMNKEIYEVRVEALDENHERDNIKSISLDFDSFFHIMEMK